MKHLAIFISLLSLFPKVTFSQDHNIHPVSYIFNPYADAHKDITEAIATAARDHKHVLVVIGGDWGYWCRELIGTLNNPDIKKYTDSKYVIVRVNFSPLNKNEEVLDSYQCPKNQGYPLLLALDEKGNKTHVQDTDPLKFNKEWYNQTLLLQALATLADENKKH